jgi:hypothetical protein
VLWKKISKRLSLIFSPPKAMNPFNNMAQTPDADKMLLSP